MKKVIFIFAAVTAISLAACTSKVEEGTEVNTDSTAVVVDSTKAVVDTTAADTTVVK